MRRFSSVVSTAVSGAVFGAAVVVVTAVPLLQAAPARAAAYYVGDIGARTLARGGANVVNPRDPSAVWLNPAAITLSTGVQLQLDLNLVWLTNEFVRDCGGEENGCAPDADVERVYNDPATGEPDEARAFRIAKDSRKVGAVGRPGDGSEVPVDPASAGRLGRRETPSRFDGETGVKNEAAVQPIPRLFATLNTDSFGLDGVAIGAYVFAPSSGDYLYPEDAATRYTLIQRDIAEIFYGITLAYRFQNWIAVGASLQGVTSTLDQTLRLSADGSGNEDPGYDVQVRVQGAQHLVPSGNFGFWSNPLKPLGIGDLEVAGSVQLPRYFKLQGPIAIQSFGPSLQANFIDSGLATINDDDATATAEFVMPPFYRVGVKYGQDDVFADGQKTFGFDVEVDFAYEQWSTYDHVFLTPKDLTFAVAGGEAAELPPIVQPKDWQDAWSVRAGTTLAFFDRMLEVHGGGFYETSAIPDETYSVELVDGEKVGVGCGVSGTLWGVRLDVAYGHVFVFDRTIGAESIVFNGAVALPPPVGAESEPRTKVAMGTYTASYDMLNVGLTVAFDDLFNFGVHAPRALPDPAIEPLPVAPETTTPTETTPETTTPTETPTETPTLTPTETPTPAPTETTTPPAQA